MCIAFESAPDREVHLQTAVWREEGMGGWVDGWMDGWMDGWTVGGYRLQMSLLESCVRIHDREHENPKWLVLPSLSVSASLGVLR